LGRMETVALLTVGCKLNQYETQLLSENLQSKGYQIRPWGEGADIVVVNTCSVTSRAEATARNFIQRSTRFVEKPYLVVTGCYARRRRDELTQIDGVNFVGDSDEVLNALTDGSSRVDSISSFDGHTRAFVKIQDGCDNFCAFCILPYLRGSPRSRPSYKILTEISTLCGRGYAEVVLTGINIGNYRDKGLDLIALLRQLEEVDLLKRVRVSSIEPTYVDQRFFEYLSHSRKFCAHLHIPLQSGDRATLKRMGRRYSPETYASLLTRLREISPEIAVGADVIVGFPGENEERFENTASLIRELPISYLHVFRYSPREGTAASRFRDTVPEDLKKRRCARLISLGAQKWFDYRKSFIGHEVEVLIEHRREVRSNKLMGLSANYIRVLLDGEDDLMGKFVTLKLKKVVGRYCHGEIVDR